MTKRIRDNWRWVTLSLFALALMANLLWQVRNIGDFGADAKAIVESGKWAARFLLLSLAMTPLNTLFGWRSALKWRKPAGLWAFGFGVLHFVLYVRSTGPIWLEFPIPDYMAGLGVLGLGILAPLAATSTRWAMKRMGRWWKRLHRMVYAAGVLVIIHGLLEATNSKRAFISDPLAPHELRLYLIILIVLLAARIPVVRAHLAYLRHRWGARGRIKTHLP